MPRFGYILAANTAVYVRFGELRFMKTLVIIYIVQVASLANIKVKEGKIYHTHYIIQVLYTVHENINFSILN